MPGPCSLPSPWHSWESPFSTPFLGAGLEPWQQARAAPQGEGCARSRHWAQSGHCRGSPGVRAQAGEEEGGREAPGSLTL